MKSNFKKRAVFSKDEMQEYIDKAWEQRAEQMFESCKRDIIAQLMSCCCMALHNSFGFGKKRLNRFKKATEDVLKFEAFRKKSSTEDCINIMKEKFGIDFDKKGD
ncbi:MAG: hypothetical protein ACI4YB_01920 [Oscillospiraceae bacterium]